MGINKVQYGNTTLIDLTSDTVTADKLMQGYTAHDRTGAVITGTAVDPNVRTATITSTGSSSFAYVKYNGTKYYTAGNTFTFQAGETLALYASGTINDGYIYINGEKVYQGSKTYNYTLPDGDIDVSLSSGSSSYIYVTELSDISALNITQNGTYTASGSIRGYSPITVNVSGGATLVTKNITANGTYNASSDSADGYSSVTVNVSGGTPSLQNKTVTPTTSQQTVQADSGYDGLDTVTVNAMPTGTAGTPTATKGTVSNHSVSVTPSVTNTTGYITGGTKTGTAVTVSASELVSGSETKTANGTYNVTNLASLVVNIPFVTYYTGTTVPSTLADGDIFLKVVS